MSTSQSFKIITPASEFSGKHTVAVQQQFLSKNGTNDHPTENCNAFRCTDHEMNQITSSDNMTTDFRSFSFYVDLRSMSRERNKSRRKDNVEKMYD